MAEHRSVPSQARFPNNVRDTTTMITITRRQAHELRAVFRRAAVGVTHRGALPPLAFGARGAELCLKHRYDALAVTCTVPLTHAADETVLLPLDALGDFEAKADTPVTMESAGPGRTVVRWEDRHVPQAREYAVPAVETPAPFPEEPASWSNAPAGLIDALAAASETCADSDTRYALSSVQLRGRAGELVATDGGQLIVLGGFSFPWRDDLLVKRSPVFATPALRRGGPVTLGRTATHVVLRAGPWTLFLELRTDVRYPDIARVVPGPGDAATRLRIDEADAAFLAQALDGLPGAGGLHHPATLDLNGRVAVRARGDEPERVTELVLSRSRYTGSPVRLSGNRDFLARALRLGFRELEVQDPNSPVAARDGRRLYLWQPLNAESAIGPSDDVTRIESCPDNPSTAATGERTPKASEHMNEKQITARNGLRPHAPAAANGHAAVPGNGSQADGATHPEGVGPAGLTGAIREAEALHEALAEAKRRTARLVAALRRQKKRDRLVATTLTALKELNLNGVPE
jgi:hypothetical protein